jgi:hypothetical protein
MMTNSLLFVTISNLWQYLERKGGNSKGGTIGAAREWASQVPASSLPRLYN